MIPIIISVTQEDRRICSGCHQVPCTISCVSLSHLRQQQQGFCNVRASHMRRRSIYVSLCLNSADWMLETFICNTCRSVMWVGFQMVHIIPCDEQRQIMWTMFRDATWVWLHLTHSIDYLSQLRKRDMHLVTYKTFINAVTWWCTANVEDILLDFTWLRFNTILRMNSELVLL